MRAGEEYSELAELGGGGSYGGRTWGRGPTGGGRGGRAPAEAEDALGPNGSPRSHSRGRSGLYYSPPGTSYTIVERPSSVMHHHSSREYANTATHYNSLSSPRGVGVYISRVEEGSVAERAGLRPGDSILEVNGTPFTGISHEEALKMLKSCRKLSMTVRSPALPGGGVVGGGAPWQMRQTCSWMDRHGRPVSPPLEYSRSGMVPPQRYGWRSSSKDRSIRRIDFQS
ncbi:hypothetical protein NQ315_008141 [Exocentrus adspersus]|uniref:PDZ domain-containing protein n=1 Tax=Exocentrus adspersus TaxID=1586481 RepID=A0AAV8VW34_9CUCU|nr:hypothetical protein NQ315_008141 [Exocentrus adspersus]